MAVTAEITETTEEHLVVPISSAYLLFADLDKKRRPHDGIQEDNEYLYQGKLYDSMAAELVNDEQREVLANTIGEVYAICLDPSINLQRKDVDMKYLNEVLQLVERSIKKNHFNPNLQTNFDLTTPNGEENDYIFRTARIRRLARDIVTGALKESVVSKAGDISFVPHGLGTFDTLPLLPILRTTREGETLNGLKRIYRNTQAGKNIAALNLALRLTIHEHAPLGTIYGQDGERFLETFDYIQGQLLQNTTLSELNSTEGWDNLWTEMLKEIEDAAAWKRIPSTYKTDASELIRPDYIEDSTQIMSGLELHLPFLTFAAYDLEDGSTAYFVAITTFYKKNDGLRSTQIPIFYYRAGDSSQVVHTPSGEFSLQAVREVMRGAERNFTTGNDELDPGFSPELRDQLASLQKKFSNLQAFSPVS